MSEHQRIKEIFDEWYYDGFSSTNTRRSLGQRAVTNELNQFLKWTTIFKVLLFLERTDLPHYKILDAGCGNGNALRKIVEAGANPNNCYGIDISQKVIDFAKAHSSPYINFDVGFIDGTKFESDSFDLIFNFGVLVHILDDEYIKKVAEEFHRVIKKDGLIFIIVSDEGTPWGSAIAHTTRNFDLNKNELQDLFPQFECLGILNTYADKYPDTMTPSSVMHMLEQHPPTVSTPFKLVVFTPKQG